MVFMYTCDKCNSVLNGYINEEGKYILECPNCGNPIDIDELIEIMIDLLGGELY